MSERISLHRMAAGDTALPADEEGAPVGARSYSRFKHGDGEASLRYGRDLADRFHEIVSPRAGERIFVTSSGYADVPPAARSLVAPFVARMRRLAPTVAFTPLRVHRFGVTPGDYAAMSAADRAAAVTSTSLFVDPRTPLDGARVVALDDIRVTGTHERAMDACLGAAGASWIDHLYVIDAHAAAGRPTLESELNSVAAANVAQLSTIAGSARFIPNARLAKKVATLDASDQEQFLASVPVWVRGWILDAVERDGLQSVPAYATGVRRLLVVAAGLARAGATA